MSKPSGEDPARSLTEQPDAERAYQEALAALDDALRQLAATPFAGEFQAPESGAPRGWRQRLSAFAWRRVPLLRQQRSFNATLVETLTRFARQVTPYVDARDRELSAAVGKLAEDAAAARQRLAEDAAGARQELAEDAAGARQELAEDAAGARDKLAQEFTIALGGVAEDAAGARDKLAQEFTIALGGVAEDAAGARDKLAQEFTIALGGVAEDAAGARDKLAQEFSAALGGVADEMLKQWESVAAREQRRQARVDELRQAATSWRQVTGALRQELERLQAQPAPPPTRPPVSRGEIGPDPETQLAAPRDSYKYVGFEDRFRGAAVNIRASFADYAPQFEGAADVLDAGCGRGEFLEILRDQGISATGVDINPEMVAQCRARGLQVVEGDLLAHLASLPDASLGGLFAAQVVEHLEPAYLLKFIDTAFLKLRPGARIVLETINVASWSAFFQSYVRDITHVRPLHPETLAYLVTAGGFQNAEVAYRSPFPPEHRLARAPAPPESGDERLDRMTAVFNRNVDELNRLLFADQDYAVIAERG